MDVQVKVDTDRAVRLFGELARKHVPFATAVAINRVAHKSRKRLAKDLPKHFIRRSSFVEKRINVENASKANPVAEVGARDDFMLLQETGGQSADSEVVPFIRKRDPKYSRVQTRKGATRFSKASIPFPKELLEIKQRSRKVKRNEEGRRVRSREKVPRFFRLGKLGIFERQYRSPGAKGKSGRKLKSSTLVPIYLFRPDVRISKRWTLRKTVEQAVKADFEAEFDKAMRKALSNAGFSDAFDKGVAKASAALKAAGG